MEEMSLKIDAEQPTVTFEELEITWPEVEELCGVE